MPHRVANFLRTSSGTIPHIKKKKSTTAANDLSRNSSLAPTRNNSLTTSPDDSDSDDHHSPRIMPDHLAEAIRRHHRLSFPFARSSASSATSNSHPAASGPVGLDCSVESPPIVFHGSPEDSTGALISGQMFLDVRAESVDVERFAACLEMRLVHRRPFQNHCSDCQRQSTDLKTWRLLRHTTTLKRGRHLFPFSALLDGKLPASMDTPVISISYHFRAEAVLVHSPGSGPGSASPSASVTRVCFERPLDVKRSLPEPLYPHHSVRVFPPTNIKASAHYSAVIHPTGSNQLTLKLDGLLSRNEKARTVDLWRLKKLTWRLEETVKTRAPACDKHAPPGTTSPPPAASDEETAKKTVARTETRVLGEKQLHDGWKSDFGGTDGVVEMEFDFGVNQHHHQSSKSGPVSRYACDTKTPQGTEVTHSLLIELIVSKEYAPEGKTFLATQTGTGRILRMHFAVVMTEFPGLGVSWDNEAPPVYQDVPPSPPGYSPCRDGESPVEYEELEALVARRPSFDQRQLSAGPSSDGAED
ncbi:hypothetical protein CDD82_7751 [Ophiocordyceps australis]|uniref:LDB19 N-terminal domain-containing protein n=1 Tax=Ophiocordyceps australis TaxID=1399860 RepID=A0A2C5YIV6_9HYPO|nr:hypothetical protein CDD82_7751 [Ophiocordyceps australis]